MFGGGAYERSFLPNFDLTFAASTDDDATKDKQTIDLNIFVSMYRVL